MDAETAKREREKRLTILREEERRGLLTEAARSAEDHDARDAQEEWRCSPQRNLRLEETSEFERIDFSHGDGEEISGQCAAIDEGIHESGKGSSSVHRLSQGASERASVAHEGTICFVMSLKGCRVFHGAPLSEENFWPNVVAMNFHNSVVLPRDRVRFSGRDSAGATALATADDSGVWLRYGKERSQCHR